MNSLAWREGRLGAHTDCPDHTDCDMSSDCPIEELHDRCDALEQRVFDHDVALANHGGQLAVLANVTPRVRK